MVNASPSGHVTGVSLKTIALTGASGYLGKQLIKGLANEGAWIIAPLYRAAQPDKFETNGRPVHCDLLQPHTLDGWLSEGCTVVHTAYMWGAGREANLQATVALAEACRQARVRRLVHISTAAVSGRVQGSWVDEDTLCKPVTEYGQTKLEIERLLSDAARASDFDLVVLRPTSVYGPGGAPLEKMCKELIDRPWPMNYLRASLFGRRAMNLVHVEYVVAAIRFAIEAPGRFDGAVFIVSEDSAPANNFRDVEHMARQILGVREYPLPLCSCPSFVLGWMLRALRRNIVDPSCRFSDLRLKARGFKPPWAFEEGLTQYFTWARLAFSRSDVQGSRR